MAEDGGSPASGRLADLPAAAERGMLAEAVEALSEGFALFDAEGRLVLWNSRFVAINPAVADLIAPGADWQLLLREAQARGVIDAEAARRLALIENRLEPGAPPETIEITAPNGAVIALTLSATDRGGFVLTQRDVTARRQLEAHEREADLMLRRVLEACPANVVMSRLEGGQIVYRSPAATELIGPARNMRDYVAEREELADLTTALLPDGRVDAMQVVCLRTDGSRFPAAISARVIDHRGEDVVVSTIVDLTHELEMQAELAQQRETIFQAEKMSALGELLAGVAHELNNPLSVVVGHALMLREETADPEVLRRIDKIGQAAERCARIVKSFLAMARQEPAVLAPVDLDEAAAAALDAVRHGASPVAARLDVRLAGDLPPVMADAGQIAQVVVNLVCNADQAIAATGRSGRIEVATRRARGGGVELAVADDGPGIPEELRSRVFDPFFTTKDVGEGTGLGLALCHRIVVSHGGRIRVDARPGGGAVFTVTLPAASGGRAAGRAEAPANGRAVAPVRVLVVEDEPEVAELVVEILRRAGLDPVHAASAEAALERLGREDFAAILSDLAMPGLGGRGFYERLARERPALTRRVAFVTGDTMGPSARAFLETTGRPRLEKPIAPAELRALVRRLLEAAP